VELFELHSARLIWTDPELNYAEGKLPEPVRFVITFFDFAHNELETKVDYSETEIDQNVEFVLFPEPVKARYVRMTICRDKNKYRHGVTDFTVFGYPGGETPKN
jgi:hypothetical protein